MAAGHLWRGKQGFQPATSEQTQLYDAQQSAIAAAMAATAANSNNTGYNDARKRRALEKKFARAMGRAVAAIGRRQIAAKEDHEAIVAATSPLLRRDSGLDVEVPKPPKTVTVEIIYTFRDVTGIQPFEIDAVPRVQRPRSRSDVSPSLSENLPALSGAASTTPAQSAGGNSARDHGPAVCCCRRAMNS